MMKTPVGRFVKDNVSMLVALVVIVLLFSFMSDKFFTRNNMFNVLRQISTNAIIAFGMTFVLLIGGIDLSVGSIVAATNCIFIGLMVRGVPIAAAIFLGVLLGGGIGFVNGIVIAKWKIPPFIATLAMMTIGRGIAYVYTDGKPVRFDDDSLSWIGNGYVNVIPVPVLIMFACLLLFGFILHKTQYGSRVYAVGGNREAARYSGIKISGIEISVYVISGILSAVSGIILSSRMLSAQPVAGQGAELDAIAAVVLGGTSLSGGVGSLGGTIIGALFIGMMNNGLNIIQVPFYWQQIIKGAVIIIAVLVDVVKNKKLAE
jgi:ribose transport system permease protein